MKIKKSRVVFPDPKKFNISISMTAQDFILKLLEKSKSSRLGYKNDWEEIIVHPWFEGVDQHDILDKNIVPPFIPKGEDLYGDSSKSAMEETYIPKEKV